jgi:high-affinity Fe2+/Pb2+ permease
VEGLLDRLSDLALFLSPFVIFGLLWLGANRGWPSVLGAVVFLLLIAAAVWLVSLRRLPAHTAYRPAQLVGGRVLTPPRR